MITDIARNRRDRKSENLSPQIFADVRGSKTKAVTAKDAKECKGEIRNIGIHATIQGVRDEAFSTVHDAWVTLVSSGADPSPSHKIADTS